MNKKALLIFIFFAICIVSALWIYCMPRLKQENSSTLDKSTISSESVITGVALEEVYERVIDLVWNENLPFNQEMRYIALDTSMFTYLSESEKETLCQSLEKYGLTVLDKPFETLQQEGYIKDLMFTDGLFLQIEDEVLDDSTLILYPSKWRSPTNHIGCSQILLKKQNNTWSIDTIGTWWSM